MLQANADESLKTFTVPKMDGQLQRAGLFVVNAPQTFLRGVKRRNLHGKLPTPSDIYG